MEKESDMAGFLSLKINRTIEGEVVLSQTDLIDRILSAMNMAEFNHKFTPIDTIHLGKGVDRNARGILVI